MAFALLDRVWDTSTTTGTGNFTISGTAEPGYRTIGTLLAASDTFYYTIAHRTAVEFETGLGTYNGSGVFVRTTVYQSSNSNAAVNFSAGTKDVFIDLPAYIAERLYYSGGTDVALADGGTGVSLTDPNADRFLFWDDSAGSIAWLAPASHVEISTTTFNGNKPPTMQTFTADGTWTKPTGCRYIEAWLIGGGGGGGGGKGAASQTGQGSGGGAGSLTLYKGDVTGTSSETVTIGAAGTAGTNAPTAGGNGGATSLGSLADAPGGTGGLSGGASATPAGLSGGAGGVAGTNGTLKFPGSPGLPASRYSTTQGLSGSGASSIFGGGGNGRGSTPGVGDGGAGTGYGAGGGGGYSVSTTGQAGGAGTAGLIIVKEFY
jgi:hypothetical protein